MARLIALRRFIPDFIPDDEGDQPVTQNPASEALTEALQNKLKSLCDSPLTARSLFEIEQTAALARQLLSLGKPGAMPQRKMGMGAYINAPISYEDEDGSVSLASSPKAETFGATVIREAVSAYTDIMNRPRPTPPHELIMAIQYARSSDLPDLASKLEKQLEASLVGPEPPVQAQNLALPELTGPKSKGVVIAETVGFACTAAEMSEVGS